MLDSDCVIVPGLGGFMAHSIAAHYDEREQQFMPPCRQLGFNPQLRLNDSLLVQSYIEVYDLSYPEALRLIEREVEELKLHLTNQGCYYLTNIGELRINVEGHLEFEPDAAGLITPALYGLSPLKIQPFKELPLSVAATPTLESAYNDKHSEAVTIKLSWIRNVVAAAAAVVAFLLMSTPISNSDVPLGNDSYAQTNVQEKTKAMELGALTVPGMSTSVNQVQDMQKAIEIQEKEEIPEDVPETVEENNLQPEESNVAANQQPKADEVPADKTYYCIVLASQVSKRNADSYVDQLQRNGFTEAKVTSGSGMRRVVYGNYPTENAAYNELRAYRKSHFFQEAWVMKVKPEQ